MKEYEIYSDLKTPKGSKIILRLDGRNFHSLSKNLNLKRPYDDDFIKSMVYTSKDIFKEFSPLFIYTFSDEINILLSEIPFSGRIEKLNSIFPSLASSALMKHLNTNFFKEGFVNNKNNINKLNINKNNFNKNNIISFDSRVIPISITEDVVKYFKWRQDESWRNCVNSYGYWTLRDDFSPSVAGEKLKNLNSSDIHQLLFEKGINLNDSPSYQKRGIAIYKTKKEISRINPKTNNKEQLYRNTFFIDKELPIFDKNFFKNIDIL